MFQASNNIQDVPNAYASSEKTAPSMQTVLQNALRVAQQTIYVCTCGTLTRLLESVLANTAAAANAQAVPLPLRFTSLWRRRLCLRRRYHSRRHQSQSDMEVSGRGR